MDTIIASFEEHYSDEAEFSITVCEEDEGSCMNTVMLCPEAAADVFVFADDQLPRMARSGALLPVSQDKDIVISENGGTDSAAITAASCDGTLYAYPLTASNGYFLYYNADYFTEDDVKSLEGILSAARKNNKKFSMEITSGWYLYSFFKAAGLDVYENEDGVTNTCEWNNRVASDGKYRGVDVLEKLIKVATDDGFLNAEQTEFVEGIKNGTIIAGISGTWNSSVISEAFGDGYRAAKLPTFEVAGDDLQMHSVAGYKLVGVSAYSKEPEWSGKLAEWITNEDNQLLRFEMRGEGPSNINAAASEKVQSNEAIAALGEQSKYGHLQIVANCYWSPAYQLGNTISSGNIEKRDLQELLDEMVENASKEN
ncbi:MAG: extracellular solute-binding protein [Oscillospiraceae bacterium]